MRLKVKALYRCRDVRYEPGEIDVPDDAAAWLLRDAPGTFEVVQDKAMERPPADKMVRKHRSKRK